MAGTPQDTVDTVDDGKEMKQNTVKTKEMKLEDCVFRQLEMEKTRLRNISEQLSASITDVFVALGNHDVRFDFDPFSLDDCRCNFVTSREINMLCSLKHVPLKSLVIEEDPVPGQVKLRLRDGLVDRYDGPSWEDIFIESPVNGRRYLDTMQLLECFSRYISHAVHEVYEDSHGACSVSLTLLRNKSNVISLLVQLSEGDTYRVNLFPSIRVNEYCDNFDFLSKIISTKTPKQIVKACLYLKEGIHLVARPGVGQSEGEYWRITFNDIERSILLSDKFQCGNDCFLLLNMLNNLRVNEDETMIGLNPYCVQLVILSEMFKIPDASEWSRGKLTKRMMAVLKTLEGYLKKAECLHVFTDIDIFPKIDPKKLDEMRTSVKSLRGKKAFKSALLSIEGIVQDSR